LHQQIAVAHKLDDALDVVSSPESGNDGGDVGSRPRPQELDQFFLQFDCLAQLAVLPLERRRVGLSRSRIVVTGQFESFAPAAGWAACVALKARLSAVVLRLTAAGDLPSLCICDMSCMPPQRASVFCVLALLTLLAARKARVVGEQRPGGGAAMGHHWAHHAPYDLLIESFNKYKGV
jgi:hypothetical protein